MEATVAMRTTSDWIPAVDLPEGQAGAWAVERFTISEDEARFDAIRSGGRSVRPGSYTRLMRGRTVVMSDTPAEKRDHLGAVLRAEGDVLVAGLGLGMAVAAMLNRPEVRSVTVIEQAQEVIDLVAPTLQARYGDRLRIVHADAYTWKPAKGERWDSAWYDIWDHICGDNTREMGRLRRHYGRRVLGVQGCWAEAECKAANRKDRRWAAMRKIRWQARNVDREEG